MNNNIVPFSIKSFDGKSIRINPNDRYVCLTDVAAASGKKLGDWTRQSNSSSYLAMLSSVTGIPATELLIVGKGNQPTWGHPKVAIRFAQWCSDKLAVQVDVWIDELLTTGKVSIAPEDKPVVRELPQRDAIDYINATATLATIADSRLKRLLDARLVAELSIDVVNQKQIAPAEEPKNYTTATVRAAMLGYSAKQIGNGSSLGKFVKSKIAPDFSDWQGQYSVAHYEVCDELDSCIHAYFLTRSL